MPSTLTSANNYVWHVISDGSNLAIYNGDGRTIGVNGNVKMRLEDAWQFVAKDNGYYYLTNPDLTGDGHNCLNASNGGYTTSVGGTAVRTATTWTGDDHNDNLWKFNPVEYSGLTVYNVEVTGNDSGYAIYNDQEAFNSGFFFVNGTLSDGDVTAATFAHKQSTVTIDNTLHTITVAYTDDSEVEILQDKMQEMFEHIWAEDIGYPDINSDANYDALEAMFEFLSYEGVTESNYLDALNAYNGVLALTDVYLPVDGQAYTFTSVHPDKEYYVNYTSSGLALVQRDADTVLPSTATFIAHKTDEGGHYIFVNNDGKYLAWKGSNAGTNGNKGYTDQWDSTESDITIEKMVTGGQYNDGTNETLFGCVDVLGYRGDANVCFVTNNNGSFNQDGSKTLRYNTSHSTAFKIEKAEYPYNHPTLAYDENTEAYYATIYLPFPMQMPDGVECYRGVQDRGDNLALAQVNADNNNPVPAGGYVLYSNQEYMDMDEESDTYNQRLAKAQVLVTPAAANPAEDTNIFTGSTADGDKNEMYNSELAGRNPYVLAKKSAGIGFYRYTATTYPKGKAIWLGNGNTSESVGMTFDDIVEAIKAAKAEENNGIVFDLQGRRLQKAQKGINLTDRKKVLAK